MYCVLLLSLVPVFDLVQFPPGRLRRFVMLVMISKKITRKHGPPMRPFLTPRLVRLHRFSMGQPVWPESSEIKQLKGSQNGGDNPKKYQVELINPDLQNIKYDCQGDDLSPAYVIFQERKPPAPEILGYGTIIRIFLLSGETMV